jgi:D-alanyl-D-alanine carboxypeptidase/D-alanyl-D-alanine-endopeptidase (penicillin-binding protein 4)
MAAPARAAETVSLSASRTSITYGQTVPFAGRVDGDPGCVGGRAVKLAWRAGDGDPWAVVASGTTAADGTFSFRNGQDHTGRFRAQLPSTVSCAFAASTGIAVRVHALVDTSLVAGSLDVGSCVDVNVRVSPPKPGQSVRLQRKASGSWRTVQTLTLDGTSSARAEPCFAWADLGVVRLRVRWPAQDALNATGTGITLAFAIGKSPWMRAIDDAIGRRGFSVAVADGADTLYARAAGAARTPASNEKLLLSMALLERFGPDHRIATSAAASKVRGGVVRGDLWILGRGDPETGPARLRALAARLRDAGVTRIRGRVMGATTYFRRDWWAPGWKPRITRRYVAIPTALTFEHNVVRGREIRDPERRAAASLTTQLERLGIRVRGRPGDGAPPAGVAPIAQIRSRPLTSLLAAMDRPSDNYYAEVLGKALAAARSGPPGSIPKAASAIRAFTGSHGASFELYDSSGLSYANRVTASGILRLLAYADTTSWGAELRRALPSGGQGTLVHRLHDVRVRAKTGTLDGISALSGWVWLTRESRWVEFSILSAGMSKATAVQIEDKIVHVLANRATIA